MMVKVGLALINGATVYVLSKWVLKLPVVWPGTVSAVVVSLLVLSPA